MKPAEFRVFLSSTFTDLQPEREQLVKKTFPRIRAKCRERGVEFTEIDLRWGITTEEAQSGKVIRICLEEIDRCRPYLIGILGSRYGWIPTNDDIEKDPMAMVQFPWLRKYVSEKKSITEMEIAHAVILHNARDSSFFYEQTANRHLIAESEIEPFNQLKGTLRQIVAYREFDSPAELGEAVYNDLLSILDRDWPIKQELTPIEEERMAHDGFALNRTRSYVANPQYYERFEAFISSTDAPLVIWGKSGLGKSALISYLSSEYAERHPEAFIVRHFVGATATASSAVDVMRHVMLEIKERYELSDDLPSEEAIYIHEFPAWLAKVRSDDPLILILDAVNQLSGIGPEMHWLPEFIPSTIRLVISTTPELPLEQFRKRDHSDLEIKALDATQRKRISEEFLARYHKHLSSEQIEVIAEESTLDSPLFLRTILEELRVFGLHSAMDMHLANYLASESESELFQKVLARMERDHGIETVRSIMTAIWASRNGLTETELIGTTNLSRLALSEFLIALEFHLMQRGGLYTFFHNYLRQAVEMRYLHSDTQKQTAHQLVGQYFSRREYSERRRDEEPYQWQQSNEKHKLHESISNLEMFRMLSTPHNIFELISYWRTLEDSFEAVDSYAPLLKTLDPANHSEVLQTALSIALFFKTISKYAAAESVLKQAVEISDIAEGDDIALYIEVLVELGEIYYYQQKLSELAEISEEALDLINKLGFDDPKLTVRVYQNLTGAAYAKIDATMALHYAETALKVAETITVKPERIIGECYENIGAAYTLQKDYTKALEAMEKAYEIKQKLFGETHPQVIALKMNIGELLRLNNSHLQSEKIFKEGIELLQRIYGQNHILVAEAYNNLSLVHIELHSYPFALKCAEKTISIGQRVLKPNHYLMLDYYSLFARCLAFNERPTEALEIYRKYNHERELHYGKEHPLVIDSKEFYESLMAKANNNRA